MIEAAIAAGADTAYLSGSGPTVAAITSGAAGDIFLQRTKERVDKQVNILPGICTLDAGVWMEHSGVRYEFLIQ